MRIVFFILIYCLLYDISILLNTTNNAFATIEEQNEDDNAGTTNFLKKLKPTILKKTQF